MGTREQFRDFEADKRLAAISAKREPLEMIARVMPIQAEHQVRRGLSFTRFPQLGRAT